MNKEADTGKYWDALIRSGKEFMRIYRQSQV